MEILNGLFLAFLFIEEFFDEFPTYFSRQQCFHEIFLFVLAELYHSSAKKETSGYDEKESRKFHRCNRIEDKNSESINMRLTFLYAKLIKKQKVRESAVLSSGL